MCPKLNLNREPYKLRWKKQESRLDCTCSELLSAIDGDAGALNRIEERQNHLPIVNRAGELFSKINPNIGHADLLQTMAKLFADARGDFGVPEVVGSRKAVEFGAVIGDEFLLGGGCHGNDGGGGWIGNLGGDFPAGKNQA